jgi:hypothetical protein
MLLSTCPITGINFPILTGYGKVKVKQPHPVLGCSLKELLSIHCESEQDSQLVFAALLLHLSDLKLIHISSQIPKISKSSLDRELPFLFPFVSWAMNAQNCPQFKYLPEFRITSELDISQFNSWRRAVQTEASGWDTMLDAIQARELQRQREAAIRMLERPLKPNTVKPARVSRIQARADYLRAALTATHSPAIVEYYVKLYMAPATFELVALEQAKSFFLEYLPDTTLNDYTDKGEILKILDVTIVEKVGLSNLLGIQVNPESLEIVRQIRKENSLFRDDKEFITSTNRKLEQWLAPTSDKVSLPEIPIHEAEPKRENFATQIEFNIAHRQWRAQERTK